MVVSIMPVISPTLRQAVFAHRAKGVRRYVLARRLHVHPSLLSHLVNGSIPIRDNDPRVLTLAAVLGVSAEHAFVHEPTEVA